MHTNQPGSKPTKPPQRGVGWGEGQSPSDHQHVLVYYLCFSWQRKAEQREAGPSHPGSPNRTHKSNSEGGWLGGNAITCSAGHHLPWPCSNTIRKAPLGAQRLLVSEPRNQASQPGSKNPLEQAVEKNVKSNDVKMADGHRGLTLMKELHISQPLDPFWPLSPPPVHHPSSPRGTKPDSDLIRISTSTPVTKHSDCQCLGFLHHWKERASHKRNHIDLCKTWHRPEKLLREEQQTHQLLGLTETSRSCGLPQTMTSGRLEMHPTSSIYQAG